MSPIDALNKICELVEIPNPVWRDEILTIARAAGATLSSKQYQRLDWYENQRIEMAKVKESAK